MNKVLAIGGEDDARWKQKHEQKQSGERLRGMFEATQGSLLQLKHSMYSVRQVSE